MKRLSNKKRKLNYIRQKNRLRLGGKLFNTFIVSNEMMTDQKFITDHIQSILIENIKKYKTLLSFSVANGQCYDDFVMNTTTLKLTFTKLNT